MIVSFDLDGVAWKYRDILAPFAQFLKSIGVKIYVLTAHYDTIEERDKQLWKARGFPPVDKWICRRTKEEQDMACGIWKAEMVERHNIDIHFEDFDSLNIHYLNEFFDHLYAIDREANTRKIVNVNAP